MVRKGPEDVRDLLEDILGDISGTRTGVGYQLLLVERLGGIEGLLRGHAVLGVGQLLQAGQVMQERGILVLPLGNDAVYRQLPFGQHSLVFLLRPRLLALQLHGHDGGLPHRRCHP